eukprot:5134019-Prymnesium_polylepis.1
MITSGCAPFAQHDGRQSWPSYAVASLMVVSRDHQMMVTTHDHHTAVRAQNKSGPALVAVI